MIPKLAFDRDYSSVLYARNGQLLGAQIAQDGQWRFPKSDSIPQHFEVALLTFEDKRFHDHIGVDFMSIIRAIKQNIKAKKVVSGASTLTMQLARMSRQSNDRTYRQKIIEIFIALKSELQYSKDELLQLYASHAPMGGNVVGLEAASWRYFAKSSHHLSIAEASMLAVLPNAPSIIHPGKNRTLLLNKRNRLLKKLQQNGYLSKDDYELALLEKIPTKPTPLPRYAPHALTYHSKTKASHNKTTIDMDMQQSAIQTTQLYSRIYQQSDIQNMAILVLDTQSGEILAYVGNSPEAPQGDVDMIQALRSSGSVLKPLLYAHALDDGLILPKSLVRDIPLTISGYKPRNYNRNYMGAVPMDVALSRSLNIPAVELLQQYNIDRFLNKLKLHGFTSLNRSADHYGLSLILGGGEISLWELCGAYANMGRTLTEFNKSESKYNQSATLHPQLNTIDRSPDWTFAPATLSAASIHHTLVAMQKLARPNTEGNWETFNSTQPISWKTGTSYGHRDAWAVGVSPEYTVGVWVGNADGEGKNQLVGVQKAAPVLFDIFNKLPQVTRFDKPYDDLTTQTICRTTGYIASPNCSLVDTVLMIESNQAHICPYHVQINVDAAGNQVHGNCASPSTILREQYLVLPPSMAYYYRKSHPEYKTLPPVREDCISEENKSIVSLIYPSSNASIYLPVDRDGTRENAIFQAAHILPDSKLYWHLDNEFLGTTDGEHTMNIQAPPGDHKVVVVDSDGNSVNQDFVIIGG